MPLQIFGSTYLSDSHSGRHSSIILELFDIKNRNPISTQKGNFAKHEIRSIGQPSPQPQTQLQLGLIKTLFLTIFILLPKITARLPRKLNLITNAYFNPTLRYKLSRLSLTTELPVLGFIFFSLSELENGEISALLLLQCSWAMRVNRMWQKIVNKWTRWCLLCVYSSGLFLVLMRLNSL